MTQDDFLFEVDNYSNHRVLLWLALEATAGNVLELGMGYGSTPFLKRYAESRQRLLVSMESDVAWATKFITAETTHYHTILSSRDASRLFEPWSVALVDHAPGELRAPDLMRLKQNTDVIVIHDTEPHLAHQYISLWPQFKFKVDVPGHHNGAWATAVSDRVDIAQWRGTTLGGFTIQ